MKIPACLMLLSISTFAISQDEQIVIENKLKAGAFFSINSNGISPIPAFSLGKPAFIASVALAKGRFSYDPALAYSLDMKPWFFDSWFRYKLIVRPRFELKGGVNFSTFCSEFNTGEEEIIKSERYFAFSLAGTYKFSPASTLTLDYWSDNGQEKGSMTGHFVYLAYDRTELPVGKKALISINLMLFYINYTDNNDGLFVSPKLSFSLRNFPVSVFFQATQAIESNISPWPGFTWNAGIGYSL